MPVTASLVKPPRRSAGPAVLYYLEVRELLRKPDRRTRKGKRDAALLGVLLGGGLRVGEAVGLTVYDVDCASRSLVRLTFVTSKARTGRLRTVTLPAWAAAPVYDWMALCSGWLFPGNMGRHLTTRAVENIVNRYLKAIGRPDLHTHSLRHTFGSMVTRETKSLFVAQKLLGHADPRTTSHYYSAFEVSDADAAAQAHGSTIGRRRRKRVV